MVLAVSSVRALPAREAAAAVPTWDPIHLLRIVVRSTAQEVRLRVAEPSALIEARGRARPRAAKATFEGFNRSSDLPDFGRQPLVVQRWGAKRVQARFLAAVTPGDAAGV